MAANAEILAQALHFDQQGAWRAAEQLYCQVLQADPLHADALYLLGMSAYRRGRPDLAVESLRRAVALKPTTAFFHCHLGIAYRALDRLEDAIACYEKALRLQPDYGEAHNNLGAAFRGQGRLRESKECYEQALRCQPDFPPAHSNLGVAYQAEGRLDEAADCFRQALRLQPHFAEAYINLGTLLLAQAKLDESVSCYRQAVRCRPDYPVAHCDLGAALQRQGNAREALACFDEALRLKPDFADAHLAKSYTLLLAGDFERGWPEYEWRSRCPDFIMPRWRGPQPAWDGSPLGGRTILLHAEQGLGDTLQFIRYVPLVQERGGRVVVEVQAPLAHLLQSCSGIDQVIARGEVQPPFDVHAYLLSLPGLLSTTVATVPAKVPYLTADPALVAHWRTQLSAVPGFKIGINWQGSREHKMDSLRSVRLLEFAPLASLQGVHLFSLQEGAGTEQLGTLAGAFPVTDLGSRLDGPSGAFMDRAALMTNLDLVVTVDTALAHLAGALGVPVWVPLAFAADWRWLLDREDSPWYPSMRLFRQTRLGEWAPVFERLAAEVQKLLGSCA